MAKVEKITVKTRKAVNTKFYNLVSPDCKTRYFDSIPLQEIVNILKESGLILLQEDNTEFQGFFCGREASCFIEIAHENTKDENDMYKPIHNSCVCLQWYTMTSGRLEVNLYLS